MAILKKIISNKGITTEYHRISSWEIDKDKKEIKILVKHYAEDSFREEEKKAIQYEEELKTLNEKLNALIEANTDGDKTDEIVELTNKINELTFSDDRKAYEDLSIYEDIEILPFNCDEEYSFEKIYNLISKTEAYTDSKKI